MKRIYRLLFIVFGIFIFSLFSKCSDTPPCEEAIWYQDSDGDGFGNADVTLMACVQPEGYVSNSTDCDDTESDINPSATEILDDGIDNNCDGVSEVTTCIPDCSGKACGDDGCGGSCGGCGGGTICISGNCVPI